MFLSFLLLFIIFDRLSLIFYFWIFSFYGFHYALIDQFFMLKLIPFFTFFTPFACSNDLFLDLRCRVTTLPSSAAILITSCCLVCSGIWLLVLSIPIVFLYGRRRVSRLGACHCTSISFRLILLWSDLLTLSLFIFSTGFLFLIEASRRLLSIYLTAILRASRSFFDSLLFCRGLLAVSSLTSIRSLDYRVSLCC